MPPSPAKASGGLAPHCPPGAALETQQGGNVLTPAKRGGANTPKLRVAPVGNGSGVGAGPGAGLAFRYQRRRESHFRWIKAEIDAGRFGKLVQAECNISRDRLGKIDLSSWRYQAAGMPGGVMLQIGIHYVDVLEMLLGPVRRVRAASAQLVLPGDNPDVANL